MYHSWCFLFSNMQRRQRGWRKGLRPSFQDLIQNPLVSTERSPWTPGDFELAPLRRPRAGPRELPAFLSSGKPGWVSDSRCWVRPTHLLTLASRKDWSSVAAWWSREGGSRVIAGIFPPLPEGFSSRHLDLPALFGPQERAVF